MCMVSHRDFKAFADPAPKMIETYAEDPGYIISRRRAVAIIGNQSCLGISSAPRTRGGTRSRSSIGLGAGVAADMLNQSEMAQSQDLIECISFPIFLTLAITIVRSNWKTG
jgi:hypothetical protein